ncbi:MAG TPA: hypothetical protein VM686_18985, partial [Polyangiaceae bacterium]|nr:hypothetical protein [Polyangiaceae bacterium]
PVDLVTRLEPTSAPLLFFTVVVVGGHTCAEWGAQHVTPGGRWVRKPGYLPPAFFPMSLESPAENGGTMASMCGDLPRAVLLVAASYGTKEKPRPLTDADALFLAPVLANLARAAGVSPKTAPTTGTGTGTSTASGTRVTLTSLRTEIELPTAWMHKSQDGADMMKRTTAPNAGVVFKPMGSICNGPCTCARWEEAIRTMPETNMVTRPSYWVNGYYPNADDHFGTPKAGTNMCLDTPDGAVLALVITPSAVDPTMGEAKLVLERAIAARSPRPLEFTPPPSSPPPSSPPPPATESSPPPATYEEPPPYSPPSESQPTPPPPAYDSGSSSSGDDSDYSVGPFVNPHRAELLIQKLESTTAGVDLSITGAGFRLDGVHSGEDSVAFTGRYGVTFSYFDDSSVALDGDVGGGLSLRLAEPFAVIPMLGVGGDSLSGGDSGFDMDFAFYWYPGLVVQMDLGVGIEASIARIMRGGDGVPKETRAVARLLFGGGESKWALGFDYRDYETARSLGGSLGRTF